MQGYVYTRDNNGTKEAVVVDKNVEKLQHYQVLVDIQLSLEE